MGRKNRQTEKKPRYEWTYATYTQEVNRIEFTYSLQSDTFSFSMPVENTHHEVSYERKKGQKVLNRTPLQGTDLKLDADHALEDFDLIVAIDTNTNVIAGQNVSATGVILGTWLLDPESGLKSLSYRTPFCLEFVDLSEPRERIGWVMALKELFSKRLIPAGASVGVVVDAYLGEIPMINSRHQAIFGDVFLPPNITLIYSSADSGGEFVSNKLIKFADKAAGQVLAYLESGRAEPNKESVSGRPFKSYRIILGK